MKYLPPLRACSCRALRLKNFGLQSFENKKETIDGDDSKYEEVEVNAEVEVTHIFHWPGSKYLEWILSGLHFNR